MEHNKLKSGPKPWVLRGTKKTPQVIYTLTLKRKKKDLSICI